MTNNTFYFLRHAETEKNPNIPAVKWSLSKNGLMQAEKISKNEIFNNIDVIFSSEEEKAFQTAEPIAHKLGKKIVRMPEFNEVKRGDNFLTKEEFEKLKREKLEDLDCKKDGGESGREAIERFESAIKNINDAHSEKNVLIVSHGTILALYFAKMTGNFPDIYQRWQIMEFCAWGKIKGNKVEKDITT